TNYLENICSGACTGKETSEAYNKLVRIATKIYSFEKNNFILVGSGRKPQEKAIVCVAEGNYCGFGYYEGEEDGYTFEQLKALVQPYPPHPDMHKIIRSFLHKKRKGQHLICRED
ncbi:MAG: hypothetical protein M3Q97_09075, partial [Bacteroidota bacterium]|nr:hypothetical protein [Bacteroidota bacterium]